MKKPFKQVYRALLAGAAVGILMAVLFGAGLFETLELKTLDHRFLRYAGRQAPSEEIVIITIDQNSIDYLKNRMDILWKWPRDVYAYVIDYLTMAGARAVLLDMDFSDPDINRAEFEEGRTDLLLGEAIKEAGNVINSSLFYKRPLIGRFAEDRTDYGSFRRFAVRLEGGEGLHIPRNSSLVAPIPAIMLNSRGVGAANIYADRDGIFRRFPLFQQLGGDIYAGTPLALALSVLGTGAIEVDGGRGMRLGGQTIRLEGDGGIYINWYGPGGPEGGTYRYVPIADVLLSYFRVKEGREPIISPDVFRGRIALIGSNAPSLYDLKPTPFSGLAPYPGVEITATVLNNLLEGDALRRAGQGGAISLILACSILTAFITGAVRSASRNTGLALLLLMAVYLYAVRAFHDNLFVNMTPLWAGISLSFVVVTVMNYLTEGREKRWLKRAFSQYISSPVMEEITRHPEKLRLGGEKRDVTILFSDIRGFTSISERLPPEQLAHILNEYLTPMTETVFRNHGTLDKYIGDAIMAFFGAPLTLNDHPASACRAALEMMAQLRVLEREWLGREMPEYITNMDIGIGLNSGLVSVGNMGSHSRFDYTVMGDNVNLSSRLENSSKIYGVNIVASEATYARARDIFVFRELDRIRVAGKSIPINIYELMARRERDDGPPAILEDVGRFEHGLRLYRERRWEEAMEVFGELSGREPPDRASMVFIKRCAKFRLAPPPEGWDGVFERRTK